MPVAPRIVNSVSCFKRLMMRAIFRGRCNIWLRWRITCAASRSVNSVSCFKRIDGESFFFCGRRSIW